MRVALVHDYIKEFGGAERVLKTLSEMYPDAPIYTAFSVKDSAAEKEFYGKDIHESWLAPLLKIGKLYSPLRFLTPLIWGSMDLSKFDLVITSCSWYITRGFKVSEKTKIVAYCHTPPRWLYGYETSVGFTKYWPVKIYSAVVGHFMRMYDYRTAQVPIRNFKFQISNYKITAGIDYFIANSRNVQQRIKKFYRRDSVVIYPPIDVKKIQITNSKLQTNLDVQKSIHKNIYFLVVSRLVGAKGLEEAARAFRNLNYKLKIVGEAAGFSDVSENLKKISGNNIELLGRINDEELHILYAGARGFVALARDEDFGITPVEAMSAGTPVIAFNGGGFKETVVPNVTGLLINDTDEKTIEKAIKKFEKINWDRNKIRKYAQKFSKQRFEKEIKAYIFDIMKHA